MSKENLPVKAGDVCRQGDVCLIRVEDVPDTLQVVPRDNGDVVLAYGEVTGHSHRIEDGTTELLETTLSPEIERFLRVMEEDGTSIVHEEHDTIFLAPGLYKVVIQREYVSPTINRAASD